MDAVETNLVQKNGLKRSRERQIVGGGGQGQKKRMIDGTA